MAPFLGLFSRLVKSFQWISIDFSGPLRIQT
jgi:hypothetical protein